MKRDTWTAGTSEGVSGRYIWTRGDRGEDRGAPAGQEEIPEGRRALARPGLARGSTWSRDGVTCGQ